MKKKIRVLAIDDSAFRFGDGKAHVAGVVMRLPAYVEGIMRTEITVDGKDATDSLIEMIGKSRYKGDIRLIIIDGITLGGFNVVDIKRLYNEFEIPVATITRNLPDFDAIESALKKHFKDWKRRLSLMQAGDIEKYETKHNPIFVQRIGINRRDLGELIRNNTVRGALPEALRVAHLVSSALARGESYGRA